MDGDLRTLERNWKMTGEYTQHFLYRRALLRAGRPEDAGLMIGDTVDIEEHESPWIKGKWRGEVMRVYPGGELHVKPLVQENDYRVKPSPNYFAKGLWLVKEDFRQLVEPVSIDKYLELEPLRAQHAKEDAEKAAKEAAKTSQAPSPQE